MTPSEEFVLIYLTESEGWPEEWVTHRGNEPGLGYDIEIKSPCGRVFRAIEVKNLSGGSAQVFMRKSQLAAARRLGDSYWLYVVVKDPPWRVRKIMRSPLDTLSPSREPYEDGIVMDLSPPQRLLGL